MKRHFGREVELRIAGVLAVAGCVALGGVVWATVNAAEGSAYLAGQPPLDYRGVLGPPPAAASAEAAAERANYMASAGGIGGAAWQQALKQLHPASPEVLAEAACAAEKRLGPAETPATMRLIANVAADLRPAVEASKTLFHRDRPFVGSADPRACDPRAHEGASPDGSLSYSYPSGHAAFGELWALVMADAVPAERNRMLAWGHRLGDNRVVCRVHWPSDIVAGRKLADALYARISRTPRYQADIAAARAELATAPPAKDCGGGG